MLKTREPYDEGVFAEAEIKHRQRRENRVRAMAQALGYTLAPVQASESHLPGCEFLGSRACLRFADCERFSKTKPRRTMIFQRTATNQALSSFDLRARLLHHFHQDFSSLRPIAHLLQEGDAGATHALSGF
jgi:hypothetical protein